MTQFFDDGFRLPNSCYGWLIMQSVKTPEPTYQKEEPTTDVNRPPNWLDLLTECIEHWTILTDVWRIDPPTPSLRRKKEIHHSLEDEKLWSGTPERSSSWSEECITESRGFSCFHLRQNVKIQNPELDCVVAKKR